MPAKRRVDVTSKALISAHKSIIEFRGMHQQLSLRLLGQVAGPSRFVPLVEGRGND